MTLKLANVLPQCGNLLIRGELSFRTAMTLWKESQTYIKEHDELCFDFAHVTHANSAGLALLLEWLKLAARKNKKISFIGFPQPLLALINIAGLTEVLSTTKSH